MLCPPNKFPFIALTLNLVEVLEGGHCVCIGSSAGPIVGTLPTLDFDFHFSQTDYSFDEGE